MSLDRVPGQAELFVGGLISLRRYEALKKANITHVVSALRLPLDQTLFAHFKHHVVDIDDVEDENIIQHFAASNAFIAEGLDGGGGVLVHCAMGKSRSVTLVIAYLLSTLPRNSSHNPSAILSLIRQSRPLAEPNPGFMSQLALYHSMNLPSTTAELDSHPEYQRWLYQRTVAESNSRGIAPNMDEIHFADIPPNRTASADPSTSQHSSSTTEASTKADDAAQNTASREPLQAEEPESKAAAAAAAATAVKYRCRKCRHQLATSNYIIKHTPGNAAGDTTPTTKTTPPSCAHLFLEPLAWMKPELERGHLSGRLECPNPKCGGTSVGRYAWQGLKCSCGAWVVPGVSLGRGKVDEVLVMRDGLVGGVGVGGVRRPPPPGGGGGGDLG